ncbi:hypothetical protein DOTSEDRAFT_78310 [Dothistroma septosporum NZE10]|uniref:F-box domain-containing protein n=1 Tax=Dothistroma septosporum (strain NZE10 / CBS 128990) TaxID=675120 RepID=N1Q1A8_DOTSN|nr:hypothetical protein DOTSEDRAFT_78310 [Dothistroma septosporum NZE10]
MRLLPKSKTTTTQSFKKNVHDEADHEEEGVEMTREKISEKLGDKPCPLLDLPPELWVKIGKLAIDEAPTYTDGGRSLLSPVRQYHIKRLVGTDRPAVTRTCAMLCAESLPYYYRTKVDIVVPDLCSAPETAGR